MIKVIARPSGDGWECDASVDAARFQVTVSAADLDRYAAGHETADVEDLVRRSFEFLLEREPPASILRRFDLAEIRGYFPEYDRLFKRKSHWGP